MIRALGLLALLVVAGCDQKMANMPKRMPFDTSPMFSDGAAGRTPVAGTVASDDDVAPQPSALPAALPLGMLQHGQDRFNVFCSPCHAYDGHGNGRVVQRGFPAPPSYHIDRLVQAPTQHFYDVITNGYGAMYSFAGRVSPRDRWAIAAYIRALQLSQHVPANALSPQQKQALR